jgi:hypothetical protein
MNDKEITALYNAEYRALHREELNRKQRERYQREPAYREYQITYQAEYRSL